MIGIKKNIPRYTEGDIDLGLLLNDENKKFVIVEKSFY